MQFKCSHQCRTNILLAAIATFAVYALFVEPRHRGNIIFDIDKLDLADLEQELDSFNPVHLVEYKSPLDENIFRPRTDFAAAYARRNDVISDKTFSGRFNDLKVDLEDLPKSASSTAGRFHRVWTMADRLIDRHGLWPSGEDRPEVTAMLHAMAMAPIVGVDILDIGDYESGTADKWIATLIGGQKVVMKLVWGDKGKMKAGAECNAGFEMPSSEIAAFHLHRLVGFNNTPYVAGRAINIRTEILPHASLAVTKQIVLRENNVTCLTGTCYNCKTSQTLCHQDGIFEFSLAYWVPRKTRLYTFPPLYMPFSTPRMDVWGQVGFNNRSYCDRVRRTIEPYDSDSFYYDLFDFAVIDTLMYHYDSKHYSIVDKSDADGLVVRLDHGRAFCAHNRDDDQIFLAPVTQCCTLRRSTYRNLKALQDGVLSTKLRAMLAQDKLAPILDKAWFSALERRLGLIMSTVERCISANGRKNVLVDSG